VKPRNPTGDSTGGNRCRSDLVLGCPDHVASSAGGTPTAAGRRSGGGWPAGCAATPGLSGLTGALLIITAAAGARAVAGDEEAGTLDLLLAHPVSLTRLVLLALGFGTAALAVGSSSRARPSAMNRMPKPTSGTPMRCQVRRAMPSVIEGGTKRCARQTSLVRLGRTQRRPIVVWPNARKAAQPGDRQLLARAQR
jgi:hypothetical protein